MLSPIISFFLQIPSHFIKRRYIVNPYAATVLMIFYLSACNMGINKNNDTEKGTAFINLPEPTSLASAEKERIYNSSKAWFDTVLKPSGFNGGMIVAKNGNIIFEAYNGTGHLPGTDTITANTPLHIASVSKTFTAMAILKLWQDGKLNLDDEFSAYFPSFNYPGVTIRSLLNHRSGLPNYTHYMESTIDWDKTKMASNTDILNTLINYKNQLPPAVSPNTKFTYCNTNYVLLALLIEKITGNNYGNFLDSTFFLPLRMKNTFVFKMSDTTRVSPSYDWKNRLIPFNFLDAIYGDKNIYTTPEDLLIWDRALNSGMIFTQKTLAAAYTPYSNEKPGIKNYGLGWRMNIYPIGKKIIFHNGWWHGSNAVFARLLQDSATIIVIGNRYCRRIYHTAKLANLFGDYYDPEEEENEPLKPADTIIIAPKSKKNKLHL